MIQSSLREYYAHYRCTNRGINQYTDNWYSIFYLESRPIPIPNRYFDNIFNIQLLHNQKYYVTGIIDELILATLFLLGVQ